MKTTTRKPTSPGLMLCHEFMKLYGVTQLQLARAMGVSREMVNALCNNRVGITVDTALILAKVFDNTAAFWLNLQRATDIWNAENTPKRAARIKKAAKITLRRLNNE